jgi:hypothetical protein
MIPTYTAVCVCKIAEEDVFERGCIPDSTADADVSLTFEATTIGALLREISSFFGTDRPPGVLLNACDVPGRVDVQRYETSDGDGAYDDDLERWKVGRRRLWLATYTFDVHQRHVYDFGDEREWKGEEGDY